MAYLDDRQRLNKWIAVMAIPAILVFIFRLLESVAVPGGETILSELHNTIPMIEGLAMLGPLFALIQGSMILRGTASATWQNILCVILTIVGALVVWQGTSRVV